MSKKFYVTTPIYYVNDVPHIGHAYTTIAADAFVRFLRMMGKDVFFLTGTDEHGKKIERTAEGMGIEPKELVDKVVVRFKNVWEMLHISYSRFIRTTDPDHERAVKRIWQIIAEKGDIYKGTYTGWYCVPCESFWTTAQLVEGRCPDCGREVEEVSEESYFFRLSKYQERLLKFYQDNPDFIQPERRRREIIRFVEQGLKDLSVSRLGLQWGIKVPGDERHSIYVWFDALTNYLTGAGFPDNPDMFEQIWPADVHIIGKDILRFHAVYWPAFLMAAELPLPKKVFAHGWWTIEGEKMSKSKGNVVDPEEEVNKYGVDRFRYFLLREVPFGHDGDYSEASLVHRVNSELSNDLGNLFSRVCGMIKRYFDGSVPSPGNMEGEFPQKVNKCVEKYVSLMHSLNFQEAIGEGLLGCVGEANVIIDRMKPWELVKKGQKDRAKALLGDLAETLRIVACMCYPFTPVAFESMKEMIGFNVDFQSGRSLSWGEEKWQTQIGETRHLFPRIG